MKSLFLSLLAVPMIANAEPVQVFEGDTTLQGAQTHITVTIRYATGTQMSSVQSQVTQLSDAEDHTYEGCYSEVHFQVGYADIKIEPAGHEALQASYKPIENVMTDESRIASQPECSDSNPAFTAAELNYSTRDLRAEFPIGWNRAIHFQSFYIHPVFGALKTLKARNYELESVGPTLQQSIDAMIFVVNTRNEVFETENVTLKLKR